MKTIQIHKSILRLVCLAMLAYGCSQVETPVNSQNESSNHGALWNPQPGDQLTPGVDVPILNPGYWETQGNPDINPSFGSSMRLLRNGIGGTISCGSHSYMVPGNAIHGDIIATLSYASFIGVAIDCGPSPYQFDNQVRLTISYRGTQYENWQTPPPLHIYYVAPDGSLQMLDSQVNNGQKTVSAFTNHFSRYVIG